MLLSLDRGAHNSSVWSLDLEVEDAAWKAQRYNQTSHRCVSLGNVKSGFLEGKQAAVDKSEELRALACPWHSLYCDLGKVTYPCED